MKYIIEELEGAKFSIVTFDNSDKIKALEVDKIKAKIHILEGLLIALEDIDNVIKLIKTSESAAVARVKLMTQYSLTEVQAKAILDMKLSKLAKLEKIEIENEKKDLITLSSISKSLNNTFSI